MTLYTIDTSVVINLGRELPRDVHRSAWERLEALIVAGRAALPRQAYAELQRKSDDLAPWARGFAGFIVEATVEEIAVVQRITNAHPAWVQEQQNEADPWVIANAEIHERIIVTQERRSGLGTADRNLKIPNVADECDVHCLNFNGLARAEGWVF